MTDHDLIVNDGPFDVCFGCGQRNDHGLRMRFRKTSDSSVEATYTVPSHYCGPDGIVHGGIQATLLDEVMGMAIHVGEGDQRRRIVTASFDLRYRRPVATETALLIRGRIVGVEEPSYLLEGEIAGPDGDVLTTAQARWRVLD
jgi:acyl-coenzyme A thioesterase PaaI-like protein